jgi:DNA-binding NtrC family response regulator
MDRQRKEPLILVINASLDILNLFHDILDEQGYEVELSNYAFEGIHTIERLQPDLVILDFEREGKPEEWQLLKMIKMREGTAHIPLIICMAPLHIFLEKEDFFRRKNIQLLFAPMGKDEILAAVKQMLQRSDSQS